MPTALLVLTLVLVVFQFACSAEAAESKATVPLRVVVSGPIKALPAIKSSKVLAKRLAATKNDDDNADTDNDNDTDNTTTELPTVSARSFVLGNNITISQSRLVLSRLDQLFLLRQLLDTIDLAPKLASSTGKLSTMGGAGGGAAGNTELLEESTSIAEGFLFELDERAKVKASGAADADNLVAIVDVAGSKLGFGWRYTLAYWNQLDDEDKPRCAFGKSFGRYYYC